MQHSSEVNSSYLRTLSSVCNLSSKPEKRKEKEKQTNHILRCVFHISDIAA